MCWHGRRNYQCCPGSHSRPCRTAKGLSWDSRECPGPIAEVVLSRPSTGRVLTAGAIVLAVIAPIVDTAEHPAAAGPVAPSSTSPAARTPGFDPVTVLSQRSSRASRSAARSHSAARRAARRVAAHRAAVRPASAVVRRAARQAVVREATRIAVVRREARSRRLERARRAEVVVARRAAVKRSAVRPRRARHARSAGAASGMAAVIAYARAQIGKRYASGGDGPNSFDCSGFTKSAYARIGLRLPHSSGAQAARAHRIPRSAGRPGDLVVGPGHVGIYMGAGMMIDAGNSRTGVVYRRLYSGLSIARF
jgi:cell wall-associated NlpC family hydrolase